MQDTRATVVAVSPWAAARPWRSKRGPRADEIALLRSLAAGPAQVTGGPLGRCSKRGWCRAVLVQATGGEKSHGTTVFELTLAGRALIGD